MNRSPLLLLLFILSACSTPLPRDHEADHHKRCLEHGHKPGTLEFADCIKKQERHLSARLLKEREAQALAKKHHLEKRERRLREKEAAISNIKINLW